jgi:hypothetical protein
MARRIVPRETLTATAMTYFEKELDKAVVLSVFLPLIISSGGKFGIAGLDPGHPRNGTGRSHSTGLVARHPARSRGRIDVRMHPRKHRHGPHPGVAGDLVRSGQTTIRPHYVLVAATVGASVVGVVLFGTIAGSMLPFVLRRMSLDPASASAPFVAPGGRDRTGYLLYRGQHRPPRDAALTGLLPNFSARRIPSLAKEGNVSPSPPLLLFCIDTTDIGKVPKVCQELRPYGFAGENVTSEDGASFGISIPCPAILSNGGDPVLVRDAHQTRHSDDAHSCSVGARRR